MCLEFLGQLAGEIDLTFHAAEQLMEDRRTIIPLPSKADLFHSTNTLVEVYEQLDGNGEPLGVMQKALIRVHHLDPDYDFCYVLAREGFVVSAWANDKGDDHRLTGRPGDYWRPQAKAA
jgi:hypothetical protein